ncbi:MAG: hypothetical protein ACOCU6_01100 [Nanoarchaeota archaeon]
MKKELLLIQKPYPDVVARLVLDAGIASEEMSSMIKDYLNMIAAEGGDADVC